MHTKRRSLQFRFRKKSNPPFRSCLGNICRQIVKDEEILAECRLKISLYMKHTHTAIVQFSADSLSIDMGVVVRMKVHQLARDRSMVWILATSRTIRSVIEHWLARPANLQRLGKLLSKGHSDKV